MVVYLCQYKSPNSSPSPPHSGSVSKHLFSTSTTLFIPLKQVHLYPFSRFHVAVIVCSVAKSCPTLRNPIDCSTPGFSIPHHLPEFAQVHESVMLYNQLILCHLLLLLHSTFPSIRVFSSESAVCIRRPKYWSFSVNISPSNKHSGLISFTMGWLDLLAVQGL